MDNSQITAEFLKGYITGQLFFIDSHLQPYREQIEVSVIDLLDNNFKISIDIEILQPEIIEYEDVHGFKQPISKGSESEYETLIYNAKIEDLFNDKGLINFIVESFEHIELTQSDSYNEPVFD